MDTNKLGKSKTQTHANLMGFILIYQIISIIIYFIGPIDWQTRNTFYTFTLVGLYILALYLGNKQGESKYRDISSESVGLKNFISKYYTLLIITAIVLNFVALERTVRLYDWDNALDIWVKLISGEMSDLYYADRLVSQGADMFGGTLFSVVSLLLSPLTMLLTPYTIVVFGDLKTHQKLLGIINLAIWFTTKIGHGTTEGFYIVFIYLFVGFLLKKKKSRKRSFKEMSRWKKNLIIIVLAVLILVAFNFVMSDRMNDAYNFDQLGENKIVTDGNWLYNVMPDGIKNLIVWIDVYLCQGYYGMSLATTVSWFPMIGMGSSRWFAAELDSIFPGVYDMLLSVKIEEAGYNWGDMANWHSAYTWFANDVGFIGVVFVMFFLGWLFAQVYRDARTTQNPISVGLMALLVQMLLFLPCNNIVYANSHTFFPFIVYVVVWLCMRFKVRFR